MATEIKLTAVCGWAIPPAWFQEQILRALPQARPNVIYPNHPDQEEEAKLLIRDSDSPIWLGYSLGSLWLMKYSHLLKRDTRLILLAPIPGFLEEHGKGGKTKKAQLNYQLKNVKRSQVVASTLQEFYNLIGVTINNEELSNLPDKDILVRGLEFLRDHSIEVLPKNIAACFVGSRDPLLEPRAFPNDLMNLNIIEDAGHSLLPLLEAFGEWLSSDNSAGKTGEHTV